MKIIDIKAIRGPNVFHHGAVLLMKLDLGDLAETHSAMIESFNERLLYLLPGLDAHHCSPGRAGGFVERLKRGTYMGHIVEHVALELSSLAGIEVTYGKTVYGGEPGVYHVVTRYLNEEGMKFLLKTAVELVESVLAGAQAFPLDKKIVEAKEIVADTELGPSTKAIVDAADRRGVPWTRLNDLNLIQFGYGKFRRLIQATTTSQTSDIAVDIAQDKDLTKKLLEAISIRVPQGSVARNEQEAIAAFQEIGRPVALKPIDGNHGRGISLNLSTPLEVAAAYQIAAKYSETVLVEEYLTGKDYRILVVGGKMVAAAERIPAHVIGDGVNNLAALIETENMNPLRGEGHEKPMTKIFIDAQSSAYLAKQGLDLMSVPKPGEVIYLKETANLSTGGIAVDVTDQVHPEIRVMCERAIRTVGLDIGGVDLIASDIGKPLARGSGIVEVNAGPGIRMHVYPSRGKTRDVGAAIVDSMYPRGSNGRIPICAITGTNGKTTVTRLITHILRGTGDCIGTTTTDGIYIDGVKIASGDTTGPISARAVLSDPSVERAVLETARGGMIKRGLGFDWCDVGVMTNIRPDHIGQDGIETIEDILHVKSLVAERVADGGSLVLNADDPHLVALAERIARGKMNREIVFFSLDPHNETIRRHLNSGGVAYYLQDGWIIEALDEGTRRLVHVSEIPLTVHGTAHFQIANALAAIAACVAQDVPHELILAGVKSFRPNEHNNGRANLYRVRDGYIMVDYGHNPDAFKAVCEMAERWKTVRVTGVVGVPGDRSDEMIRDCARAAARGFDRIILRDDFDLRGRLPGEAPNLVCAEIRRVSPDKDCKVILDELEAIRFSLNSIRPGEIVVMFFDELYIAEQVLREFNAAPMDSLDSLIGIDTRLERPREERSGMEANVIPISSFSH